VSAVSNRVCRKVSVVSKSMPYGERGQQEPMLYGECDQQEPMPYGECDQQEPCLSSVVSKSACRKCGRRELLVL